MLYIVAKSFREHDEKHLPTYTPALICNNQIANLPRKRGGVFSVITTNIDIISIAPMSGFTDTFC